MALDDKQKEGQTSTNTNSTPPATTGGTQMPQANGGQPSVHKDYFAGLNNQPKLQTPTAQQAFQAAFPRPKDTVTQNANNAVSQPLQQRAQQSFQQSFPRPQPLQQAANQAAPVPQIQQPQKQYMYERVETPAYAQQSTYNADDYKDGTADGQARNFLSKTFVPKTEEDYSKENETTKRILALGNALRHIGNIVNTSRGAGAPSQQFNDPVALAEQQYQTGRAQRIADQQRKENAAYKQAQTEYQRQKLLGDQAMNEFKIKLGLGNAERAERKAAADEAYKNWLMKSGDQKNKDLADYRDKILKGQEETRANNLRHQKVMEAQGERKTRASEYKAYKGGGGSGGSGGGKGKAYGKFLGTWYQTKAEYDKAVLDYAQKNGIHTTYKKKHYDSTGTQDGSTETGRPISSIAAEGERHYAKNSRIRRLHGGK